MAVPSMHVLAGVSGAVAAFDPLTLSPALWLDASDASTISLDGSSKVSQWRDKSGNARHFADNSAPSERPTYADTQNSLSVVSFDGTQILRRPVFSPSTSAITIAAVLQEGASGSRRVSVSLGSDRHIAISGWNNNGKVGGLLGGVAWLDTSTSGTSSYISLVVRRSGGTNTVRMNGADLTVAGGSSSTPNTATGNMDLGGQNSTKVLVKLAEIIVIDGSALTGTDLTDLETYLADKWGL